MRKAWLLVSLGVLAPGASPPDPLSAMRRGGTQSDPRVEVVPHEDQRRVDVLVDGKPFTAYIYPTTVKKPVLYPLRAASGTVITRGWPLEPRPGERVDHPHHVGLWLTYSDVNGLDFWNNSDAIPAARAPKMGTIVHRAVRHLESGQGAGALEVTAEWVDYRGHALRVPRRRRPAGCRSDHDAHRPRADGHLRRREGRAPGPAGGACPRAAVGHRGSVHGCRRPCDERAGAQQRRRDRPLPELRRSRGRLRVGHARSLDDAVGRRFRRARDRGYPGPSEERRFPHILACARLWPVRREPSGTKS